MTSDQLVELIARFKAAADDAAEKAKSVDVPVDLVGQVHEHLVDHPAEPWDGAVAGLVDNALPGAESDDRS